MHILLNMNKPRSSANTICITLVAFGLQLDLLTTKLGGHGGFGGQRSLALRYTMTMVFRVLLKLFVFSATSFGGEQQKMAEKFSEKELGGALHLH